MPIKIGIMQGRLVDDENNKIQSFPHATWIKELSIAQKNKIKNIEYIVELNKLDKNPIYSKKGIELIKKYKKKYNILFNSMTAEFLLEDPFFYKKKVNIKKLKIVNKILRNSKKIGIKYIVCPLIENASLKKRIKLMHKIILFFKSLVKNLSKDQKILFELDLDAKKTKYFINQLDKKKFGINYDTGNNAFYKYKIKDDAQYFDRVENIHIKDKNSKGVSVRLGKGLVDFKSLAYILKKYKYNGYLIIQAARSKQLQHIKEFDINKKFLKKKIIL